MSNGTASGSWGTVLNASMITLVDNALGDTVSVAVSSSDVNLTTTQRQNLGFKLTGTLTSNLNVTLPLSPNSTSSAVGGFFIFENNATGNFAVTVKTIVSGSTGVTVPQGVRSTLYSDGTNVAYADDAQNQAAVFNGNPNGSVAGKAGSASTRASKVVDYNTNTEYLCTSSGTASGAVWSVNLPFSFPFQGYITASSDANNPVLTSDSIGATTIYASPINGNLLFVYNGVSFVPVPFSQTAIALSSSAQAGNGLYDVLGFLNGTSVVFGFSPAWQTATAGSGARGTGAGTPQYTRLNGIPVNAVQQTVNNGATTYTVGANRGTLVATVAIDATSGQVTCHRSAGQARKFGIWNFYNRKPIPLQGFDPTGSWSYNSVTLRASNGDSNNNITVLAGLPEESVDLSFEQRISPALSSGAQCAVYVGVNSTTVASGIAGYVGASAGATPMGSPEANHVLTPFIGTNVFTSLEGVASPGGVGNQVFYGGSGNMRYAATWNG